MIEWAVTSSVLIAVIIALRYILKGKISLRLQYALWGLVLLRLLIPFSIGSSGLSVMNTIQNNQILKDAETVKSIDHIEYSSDGSVQAYYSSDNMRDFPTVIAENKTADEYIRMEKILSFRQICVPLWLSGAVLLLSVFAVCNLRFASRLRKSRKELDLKGSHIPVYITDKADTPCLFGLFRPAVYLTPEAMDSETALRHVVEHEMTHYRHGDNMWSILRAVCLALHWYNPLVWWAAVLSRNDSELSCDEATIRRIGESQRAEYGRTLIGMTCQKPPALFISATTMTGGRRSIRERIALIAKKPRMAVYALIAVLLLVSVIVGCTFTGANAPWDWAQGIDSASITSAVPWDNFEDGEKLTDTEVEELTVLLNSLKRDNFTENTELVGGTPSYGIKIETSNGMFYINESIATPGPLEMKYVGRMWWIDSDKLDEFVKNVVGVSNPSRIVQLSDEQLEYANQKLALITTDADGNTSINPVSCFFTSYYDTP